MFASEQDLKKPNGPGSKSRFIYFQRLIQEFQDTEDINAKRQIISNLANFAYDPINYGFIRELNIIDLFLDNLTEDNEDIVEFAIGGICNSVCDPENLKIVEENCEIKDIIKLLSSTNINTVLSTITTMYYLLESPILRPKLTKKNVLKAMNNYKDCTNQALSNLATVYLNRVTELN